jgi:hypothetical protein
MKKAPSTLQDLHFISMQIFSMHSHATISHTEQRDVSKLADFFMQISLYMANYEGELYADHHVFCAFFVCVCGDGLLERGTSHHKNGVWTQPSTHHNKSCQLSAHHNKSCLWYVPWYSNPSYLQPSLRNQVWQPSSSCNTKVWWPGWTVFGGRKKVAHHQLLPPIIICQRFQSQCYRV